MLYLEAFIFPSASIEYDFLLSIKRTCYDSFYPFKVLAERGLERLDFEPITLLYGGNGSGKSTALHVIAEKLQLIRSATYNRSNFYETYVGLCEARQLEAIPKHSRIMTSDDVFDYMLDIRALNQGVDNKREILFKECLEAKYSDFKMKSLEDYEALKKINSIRKSSQSKYVRKNLMDNIREYSNGESALRYFNQKIEPDGLYILDEPENSLSPQRQLELVKVIEEGAHYLGCQFIIATHSPFFLALQGAKIYDLDEVPVGIKKWTELESVRFYQAFFKAHEDEF